MERSIIKYAHRDFTKQISIPARKTKTLKQCSESIAFYPTAVSNLTSKHCTLCPKLLSAQRQQNSFRGPTLSFQSFEYPFPKDPSNFVFFMAYNNNWLFLSSMPYDPYQSFGDTSKGALVLASCIKEVDII